MELSLVLQPKRVPVYDWHGNPSEKWVVEVPLGAAQTLREYNSIHHENSPGPQSMGWQVKVGQQKLPPTLGSLAIHENTPADAPQSFGCQVEDIVCLQQFHPARGLLLNNFQENDFQMEQSQPTIVPTSPSDQSPCQVVMEETVDQEQLLHTQCSQNNFRGNNFQMESSQTANEGFSQQIFNSDSPITSSSSHNTSHQDGIISDEKYSLFQDPSIVHASGDFAMSQNPLYQTSFPSLMGPYPMNQQQYRRQRPHQKVRMPVMKPYITHYPDAAAYNTNHQTQENNIPTSSSVVSSGKYAHRPFRAQLSLMAHPSAEPFSFQGCNGAFLIQNCSSQVSVFISFINNQELGLSQPLGQVCKTHHLLTCCFRSNSGKTFYVKLLPQCIVFSGIVNGVSYWIDEAGVRPFWDKFLQLEPEVAQIMWNKNCESEVNIPGTPITQSHGGYFQHQSFADQQKKQIDTVSVPEGKPIDINRNGLLFYSDTRKLSTMNFSMENFSISSTLKGGGGGTGHIKLSCSRHRFRQGVYFDGQSLRVTFHTQSASLDKDGKLYSI